MIIKSRPQIKQSCEDPVVKALTQLQYLPDEGVKPRNLDENVRVVFTILNTLFLGNVLTAFKIVGMSELRGSTYEHEKWIVRVMFTDDPAKKESYVADLRFEFKR